jgi:hypothetical protein
MAENTSAELLTAWIEPVQQPSYEAYLPLKQAKPQNEPEEYTIASGAD